MIFKNITNYRDRREKAEAQFQSILSNALGNFDRLKKQIWLIDHKNYNIFLSSFFWVVDCKAYLTFILHLNQMIKAFLSMSMLKIIILT